MSICVLSENSEKWQGIVQLLAKFGVQNINVITYNTQTKQDNDFIEKLNGIGKIFQISQQTYNELLSNMTESKQQDLELITLTKLNKSLIITIDYKLTLDKSFKCCYGLIQLNFNERKLIIFNPEIYHETETYSAIEMISFEDDYFYVHLYDKTDLFGKQITLINYEEHHSSQDMNEGADSLDGKALQPISYLGNSLTEEEAQIHKFELQSCKELKQRYKSGGHLSFKQYNKQNYQGVISYSMNQHLYSFIVLKVLIISESFQRSPYVMESYEIKQIDSSEEKEIDIENLTEKQRYKEGDTAKVNFILLDETKDAGKEILLSQSKALQLLQLEDTHKINQLLSTNSEINDQKIPYFNESFVVVKAWIAPGKSLQYNFEKREESPYDVLGTQFQSCDVAYHPHQQDACFLKAFAVMQGFNLGTSSDFIPDLDGVFLQAIRLCQMNSVDKILLLFAYFTHFFFKCDKSQGTWKKLIPISQIYLTVNKCFSQKQYPSEAISEQKMEDMFTDLYNSYKQQQGISIEEVMKIILLHLPDYEYDNNQSENTMQNVQMLWDRAIYELAVCRCNNFNIPYTASRLMGLTLQYSNKSVNMAFMELYKHIKMLPSQLYVHVSDIYNEEWKKQPENIYSRLFGEFNPYSDYLEIFYEENSLINQKQNKKLKWLVDEDEIKTIGNIINLIMDKTGVQITFLTTLSGTLAYTSAMPNQQTDTLLQHFANNEYILVLISDNDEGEEFPNIRIWF